MASRTPSQICLAVGLGLLAVGTGLMALQVGGHLTMELGLMLCVSAAALSASSPRPSHDGRLSGQQRGARRGSVIAASVLGAVILLPFPTIGALILVGADGMAIFMMSLYLFGLAGVLVVTFLVVFFVNLARTRKSATSPR